MKPKLLIIELNYHAEVLRNICSLLQHDFQLMILSTEAIWRKTGLRDSDMHAVALKQPRESVAGFFARQKRLVAEADLVYFNTLQKYQGFFCRYRFKCPTIVRVHNAHAELAPWCSIAWSLRNAPKITSHLVFGVLLQRRWHQKKRVLQGATRIMLPNSTITKYVAAQGWIQREKIADCCLPFSYLSQPSARPGDAESKVVMAVLGSVDPNRRSYDVLYAGLEQACAHFRKPVDLLFLGEARSAAGREIVKRFSALCTDSFRFSASAGYVSAGEMAVIMRRVSFLLAPVKIATQYKIHREIYGLSKISGVENDIVTFQKPALVGANYRIPDELQPVCESFGDAADLAAKLRLWVNSDRWVEKTAGFASLDSYRPEVILARFMSLAQELIVSGNSGPR